jgi:hypothetical protein
MYPELMVILRHLDRGNESHPVGHLLGPSFAS